MNENNRGTLKPQETTKIPFNTQFERMEQIIQGRCQEIEEMLRRLNFKEPGMNETIESIVSTELLCLNQLIEMIGLVGIEIADSHRKLRSEVIALYRELKEIR